MRGAQNDVLGFSIQRAGLSDQPVNRFVTGNNLLGIAETRCGLNQRERLTSARNVPVKLTGHPQPPLVTMQNHEQQVFYRGGLAHIPNAGLWAAIFSK